MKADGWKPARVKTWTCEKCRHYIPAEGYCQERDRYVRAEQENCEAFEKFQKRTARRMMVADEQRGTVRMLRGGDPGRIAGLPGMLGEGTEETGGDL